MDRPQIVLDIIEVQKKVKVLKEDTIRFIDWMRSKGIQIGYGDLKNMDKVIAGKRLAEYYQEYRKNLKHVEPKAVSSDWNKQVDAEVKLDDKFLNKFLGLPLSPQTMQEYLKEMGEDRYSELKRKVIAYLHRKRSCTLREMCLELRENVVDMLIVTLILAQSGKIDLWQNDPFNDVFIAVSI